MKKRIFNIKDKLFLALFAVSWTAISYGTYKVIGLKTGSDTVSIVQVIKTTVADIIT